MDALDNYRQDIKKLKKEKDEMLARNKMAIEQSKIADALDGLSVDADMQALEKAREGIGTNIAQAKVDQELRK